MLAAAALWLLGATVVTATGGRFSVRVWRTVDGLPDEAVLALTQTRDGYLWAGTLNGLARFDGNQFTPYDDNQTPGLKSSRIFRLFEDSQSNLWIGTDTAGIVEVKGGRVISVPPPEAKFRADRLASACEDATGAVWLYAQDGKLLHYRAGRVDVDTNDTIMPSYCRMIIAEKGGAVWKGTDFGLFTTGTNDLANRGPQMQRVGSLTSVNYLLASASGGFWCLAEGRIQKWRNGAVEKDLGAYPWDQQKAQVMCACEDREGNLVVGTLHDGVFWFNADGSYAHLTRPDKPSSDPDQDLSNNSILSLVVDREGNLWVGTNGGGLNRVKRSPFGVMKWTDNRTVQSVSEDKDGGLWVGYNGGLPPNLTNGAPGGAVNYFKDGVTNHWATNEDCFVRSVFVDRSNQLWVGTWGPWEQLQLLGGGLFTNVQKTPDFVTFWVQLGQMTMVGRVPPVSAIHQDRKGRMWFGARTDLLSLDDNGWTNWPVPHGDAPADVRAIADDAAGNVWIGTENDGLQELRAGKFVSFHKQDGLPSEHISSLYVDADGVLWVGTTGGLAWLRDGKWHQYTSGDGLYSDRLDYVIEDTRSNLWLGSNRGLIRVAKQALDQFARGLTNYVSCRAFAESDGLPNGQCTSGSQPAACLTHDGRLLFPTIRGLITLEAGAIKPNTNAPPVVIESVSVEGVRQGAQGLGVEPPRSVTFPAGREHLDIQYTSLNLGAAEKARFSYLMQGYETNWVSASSRDAIYSKLPPGNYRFMVRACNEDGVWSDAAASLAVTVLPPFWRRWWFIIVTTICLLGLIVSGVHYVSTQKLQRQLAGLRQQQALEKERARIARDIHDQLGASLTQVSLLGELVESDKESPGEVESHGRQISQTAREVSRALDEIVWTVNPSNDTLEGLVNYVCKYAQEYLAVAGLRYRLDAPPQLPATVISPEVRHNVFLAAKEAVTNVVRHAGAKSVFVRVRVEPAAFTLEIQDDGQGIANPAEKMAGSRNGLRNMSKRMEDIGGKFDIAPGAEGGTVIRLTVPLKNQTA